MTQALDLEYVVVARLRLPAPYGNTTAATACLIAPDRAVTLARLFVEGESVFGISIPLITEIDGRSEEHRATVVWTDWATNIALLAVSPPASVELPSYQHIFADTLAPPEASWRARLPRFHEDVAGPAIFYGTVVESSSSSEPGALRLRAKGEAYAPSIGLGTPVFSDYGVIGLIAGHREGNDLVAVPSLAIRQALEAHGHESAPAESRVKPQEPVSAAAESTGRSTTSSRRRTRGTPPRSKSTDSPESAKPAPLDAAALFDRLSVSSRRALAHANDLRARMGVDEVHMEHLILGLYQKDTGPTHRELHRVGITEAKLRERLNAIIEREIPPYRDAVPTLDALPPCSGHVREALIAARDKADALRASEVQSRHLLYGVLSVDKCGAVKWMLTDGVDRERIDMAAPRSSPALTEPGRYARARIDSDVAEGKELDDLLDIKREVEAICAVIAAVDTSPPLSIGLFGDWGTGKSFFMSRMKDRIDDLKAAARANPDTAYCRNIVQLRFNAWHYMDTDLWASLAAEIFEGLARELDKDRALLEGIEDTAVARARLLAATEHLRDVKTQAERSKADADAALHESEQRLASLSREERDIEARLSPGRIAKEAYRFVAAQPAAAKSLDDAAARIGIPEAKALASDTRATLLELHGVWGGIRALVLALKGGSARLWILLPLTLVLFIASLLALVQWRDRVGPVVIAAATLLGTILGFLKKVIAPTRAALTTIADARGRHDALIQQERARRRNELQQQRDAVQRRVTAEESTITRVTQEIADLEQQLEALRADRQMVAFIQAKNQSTDYTKHFGVIARARHDFERLTDLLKLVTEEAETGAATADAKTGNGAPARPTVPREVRRQLGSDDPLCGEFADWAKLVARYSFESGRVLGA